jgi:hypothetical protein
MHHHVPPQAEAAGCQESSAVLVLNSLALADSSALTQEGRV